MKVIAIIPAAGSGTRMLSEQKEKPFLLLGDKPVIAHTLSCVDRMRCIDEVIVVVKDKYVSEIENLIKQYDIAKVKSVVVGGQTRMQSVYNGLKVLNAALDDIVVIHDGARPFVAENVVWRTIEVAGAKGAAVAGVLCSSTIKKVDNEAVIINTPDRSSLWEAQTPQTFQFGIIKAAHENAEEKEVTDDSVLVENMGNRVCMVESDRCNIKITVPEDIKLGEVILSMKKEG